MGMTNLVPLRKKDMQTQRNSKRVNHLEKGTCQICCYVYMFSGARIRTVGLSLHILRVCACVCVCVCVCVCSQK